MSTAETNAAFDHNKKIKFSQILTIAVFLPQQKVDTIVESKIYGSGLYIDESYALMTA